MSLTVFTQRNFIANFLQTKYILHGKRPFCGFASQLLQWNIKLLAMFINWTNWGVWNLDALHDHGLRRIKMALQDMYREHGWLAVEWLDISALWRQCLT